MTIPDHLHPDKVNIVNLLVAGRASSFFFQGLFDGHHECMTLPSMRYPAAREISGSPDEISTRFYTHLETFFSETIEPPIPKDLFVSHLSEYLTTFGISPRSAFIGMHYAVERSLRRDLSHKRIIVVQGHRIPICRQLFVDFPGHKIVHLVRDPRGTYLSKRTSNPFGNIAFFLIVAKLGHQYYQHTQPQALAIRHEDIHTEFASTMSTACDYIGIPYDASLEASTFYGIPYTGSELVSRSETGVFSNKPDPRYVHNRWKQELTRTETRWINRVSKRYIEDFGYEQCHATGNESPFNIRSQFCKVFTSSNSPLRFLCPLVSIPIIGPLIGGTAMTAVYGTQVLRAEIDYQYDKHLMRKWKRNNNKKFS